jgi:hypothetical protein
MREAREADTEPVMTIHIPRSSKFIAISEGVEENPNWPEVITGTIPQPLARNDDSF